MKTVLKIEKELVEVVAPVLSKMNVGDTFTTHGKNITGNALTLLRQMNFVSTTWNRKDRTIRYKIEKALPNLSQLSDPDREVRVHYLLQLANGQLSTAARNALTAAGYFDVNGNQVKDYLGNPIKVKKSRKK